MEIIHFYLLSKDIKCTVHPANGGLRHEQVSPYRRLWIGSCYLLGIEYDRLRKRREDSGLDRIVKILSLKL